MHIVYRKRMPFSRKPSLPTVIEADLIYYNEAYGIGRYMGDSKYHVSRFTRKGFGIETGKFNLRSNDIDDIRILPPEAVKAIQEYDQQIKQLQSQRLDYLNDNFMAWQIPDVEDCKEVKEGKTKHEAETEMREANKKSTVSDKAIQSERRTVSALNKAINRTYKQ